MGSPAKPPSKWALERAADGLAQTEPCQEYPHLKDMGHDIWHEQKTKRWALSLDAAVEDAARKVAVLGCKFAGRNKQRSHGGCYWLKGKKVHVEDCPLAVAESIRRHE